ncbi:MAG: hypothetical protein QW524_03035 [Candidatus Woesearchaeota archaeon]
MNKKSETEGLLMTIIKLVLVSIALIFIFLPLIMFLLSISQKNRTELSSRELFVFMTELIKNDKILGEFDYKIDFILPYSNIPKDYVIEFSKASEKENDFYFVSLNKKKSLVMQQKIYNRIFETNSLEIGCLKKCYLNLSFGGKTGNNVNVNISVLKAE